MNIRQLEERYFLGMEGEGEIELIRVVIDGTELKRLRMWYGYFGSILEEISFEKDGWPSLAYNYHLDKGWNEESPWLIPNVEEAIQQFQSINLPKEKQNLKVLLNGIIEFLIEVKETGDSVYISYF